MHKLQGQYARYLNWKYDRVGYLFQGRYKSRLVGVDRYALALTRYIHRNPLEVDNIVRAEDYQWSSYRSYITKYSIWEWLETKWILDQFHAEWPEAVTRFREFHQALPPEYEFNVLHDTKQSLIR